MFTYYVENTDSLTTIYRLAYTQNDKNEVKHVENAQPVTNLLDRKERSNT